MSQHLTRFALLVHPDGDFAVIDWPADTNVVPFAAKYVDARTVEPVDLPDLTMWVDGEGIMTRQPLNEPATRLCASLQPIYQGYHGRALFTGGVDHQGITQALTEERLLALIEQYLLCLDAQIPKQRAARD
ncbi:DUF3846 domain-containing protein [Streptomyces sp. NPDC059009]|uniref:DUF3846 domain-containing protein n=1 Tax=Streptomyces sp. NPDC059009 TaxID=3346694 RepID=UPI0036D06E10